mgnify:CR=1 FL=1|jgi:hypothetical protein
METDAAASAFALSPIYSQTPKRSSIAGQKPHTQGSGRISFVPVSSS